MKKNKAGRVPTADEIERAVQAIRSGQVVAVPTETYYGLAVDPENERALAALFALKQRPKHKPILLLISRMEQLERYIAGVPDQYCSLMERYWPGPLTLVFPARTDVSPLLTGDSGTIGIRLTPHPAACRIIDLLGRPITATSANLSNHEPARTAQEARTAFGDKLGYVVDGGPADNNSGSTVVSSVGGVLCIARRGRIALPGLPDCASDG